MDATFTPKKGLIGLANRIWILPKPTESLDKKLFNLIGHFVRKMIPASQFRKPKSKV